MDIFHLNINFRAIHDDILQPNLYDAPNDLHIRKNLADGHGSENPSCYFYNVALDKIIGNTNLNSIGTILSISDIFSKYSRHYTMFTI